MVSIIHQRDILARATVSHTYIHTFGIRGDDIPRNACFYDTIRYRLVPLHGGGEDLSTDWSFVVLVLFLRVYVYVDFKCFITKSAGPVLFVEGLRNNPCSSRVSNVVVV